MNINYIWDYKFKIIVDHNLFYERICLIQIHFEYNTDTDVFYMLFTWRNSKNGFHLLRFNMFLVLLCISWCAVILWSKKKRLALAFVTCFHYPPFSWMVCCNSDIHVFLCYTYWYSDYFMKWIIQKGFS